MGKPKRRSSPESISMRKTSFMEDGLCREQQNSPEKCSQRFKFEEATTMSVEETFHSRKVREAVEIRMRRRKDAKVVNRDSGSYLKT